MPLVPPGMSRLQTLSLSKGRMQALQLGLSATKSRRKDAEDSIPPMLFIRLYQQLVLTW
jgi:hypothetical protein